jgi:predicted Zn-dependent protease
MVREDGSRASRQGPAREGRDEFLKSIEGLALGAFNKDGYIADGKFFSRKYLLSLDIPNGWSAGFGEGERVLLLTQRKDGYTADLRIGPVMRPGSAAEIAREYSRHSASEALETLGQVTRSSLPVAEAATLRLRGIDGRGRRVEVLKAFLVRLDLELVLTIAAPEEKFGAVEETFMQWCTSLKYLKASEIPEHSEPRLSIVSAKSGGTWDSIALRIYGSTESAAKLAAYNDHKANEPPGPGDLIKIPPRIVFEPGS